MARPLKSYKKLLLFKLETTFNVDASPTPTADAILCEAPTYSTDFTVLERANVRPNFSKDKHAAGRKLARIEFTIEAKSNGKQTSLLADDSQFTKVMQGCGLVATRNAAVGHIGPQVVNEHVNPVTWGAIGGTAYTGNEVTNLYMEVVTPGASATATIKVTSDNPSVIANTPAAVVTTGTPFNVGGGITISPTFTGSLVAGQAWILTLTPAGCVILTPNSDDTVYKSATLYLYSDGNLQILTGAYGTAVLNGEVNGYGKVQCSFIGQYYAPTKVTLPTNAVFEASKPAQIELARLRAGGYPAVVSRFTVDVGNTVVPRLDANSPDGYNGTYISDRNPTGGFDPEATLVDEHDFWTELATAKAIPVTYRMGTVPGNIVNFRAPAAQYTQLSYQSRDGIENYDAGLAFRAYAGGDDDFQFLIC